MAFTSDDLTAVETAISAIAAGTRVVEITVGGKTARFQAPQLPDLLTLRDTISGELAADSTTSGLRLSTTVKSDTW